tara:strand:- start:240 stop:1280 length:1041 start_codon:yes stop_codon:yes gene_type:complete
MKQIHTPFSRLSKTRKNKHYPCLNSENRDSITEFIQFVHNNESSFEDVKDPLGGSNDVIIGKFDRYGIPINTVINLESGLIRSNPYYTDQAIKKFYADFYRNIYTKSFVSSVAPKSELMEKQISKGIAILKKTTGKLKDHANILDYGCGIGATLIPFKEAGHTVTGIDYGEEFLDYGRKMDLNLISGGIEELEHRERYDLIILSHVLEHIKEPIAFLQSLKKKLTTNGMIYIEVPGIKWIQRVWNHDILLHIQNAHIWYFTRQTLEILLAKAGLSVINRSGDIAFIVENSEVQSLELDPDHAKKCLRYLKINESMHFCGFGKNRITRFLTKCILKIYNYLFFDEKK